MKSYLVIDRSTSIKELKHHGILGQQWGVRRYQNEDGSLTTAGRKRYSEDYLESADAKRMATKGLSNAELKRLNERLQLEKTYNDLTYKEKKQNESYAVGILKKIGEKTLTEVGSKVATGLLTEFVADPLLESLTRGNVKLGGKK